MGITLTVDVAEYGDISVACPDGTEDDFSVKLEDFNEEEECEMTFKLTRVEIASLIAALQYVLDWEQ